MSIRLASVEADRGAIRDDADLCGRHRFGLIDNPYTVHFAPEAIDLSLLPEGAREPGTDAFAAAISDLFAGDLKAFGLNGSVTVTEG